MYVFGTPRRELAVYLNIKIYNSSKSEKNKFVSAAFLASQKESVIKECFRFMHRIMFESAIRYSPAVISSFAIKLFVCDTKFLAVHH